MTYLIASDNNGTIASKRMKSTVMTTEAVHAFARELFPAARIYGETERAPRGSRTVVFYQSANKEGVGRNGRNWAALSIQAAQAEQKRAQPMAGTTGGFHYGDIYAPCNGVYQAIAEVSDDGRRIYECDACGARAVKRPAEQPEGK